MKKNNNKINRIKLRILLIVLTGTLALGGLVAGIVSLFSKKEKVDIKTIITQEAENTYFDDFIGEELENNLIDLQEYINLSNKLNDIIGKEYTIEDESLTDCTLKSPEEINELINDYDKNGYHWIIEIKNTNEVIGLISGSSDTIKFNYIEIGYSCGSKFWNNGYITEAVNRVIKYFIDECDFNIVETRIPSKNISSIKVAEKCNMKKEAVLKNRYINKITNDVNDILIYSITKEEY